MQETQVQSLGWEDPLEEEMTAPPPFLPGESQGQRSLAGCRTRGHRVGHDLATRKQQQEKGQRQHNLAPAPLP